MEAKITSYIKFNGEGKKALEFYHSVFGGSVESDTFSEFNTRSGNAMPVSPEDNDKIMHATLKSNYIELMISDVPSSWPTIVKGTNIVLALTGNNELAIRGYWDKLSAEGVVNQPLENSPWGDIFGSVTDKFDINWMINITKS